MAQLNSLLNEIVSPNLRPSETEPTVVRWVNEEKSAVSRHKRVEESVLK